MLSKLTNVAIVDDHTLFRKTLNNFLSSQENVQVVVQSPDIPDLLDKLKQEHVDILIMDLFMPKLFGNDAVKIIQAEYPEVRILVLSMCTDMELLSSLLDAGVCGILSKTDEPEELIQAIVALSEQRIFRSKLFTEAMYWNKQNNFKKGGAPDVPLNDREREVLQLLWEEKSNKEIADHLFLSVRSIEKIRQDMKEKLGVRSTVGLLKFAIARKIIRLHSPEADSSLHMASAFM